MTNHVHLVLVPEFPDSLARTLREVHGRYARYRNAIGQASGHLWQSRYYSCPFEDVRLPSVMRYVELNPVRAQLVRSADDYAWSSAAIHLGGKDRFGLVDLAQWQRDWLAQDWALCLANGAGKLEEEREIRALTHAGRPLGSAKFLEHLEGQLGRRLAPGTPGRPPKVGGALGTSR